MNSKTKTLIALLAFAAFIVLAAIAYNILSKKEPAPSNLNVVESQGSIEEASSGSSSEEEKTLAPDFTVLDIDGNEIKLSSLFGKPIVLNFWASWCPPCKAEMPEFDKVYAELSEDITFVMVDMVDGQRETLEKGKKHIADKAFKFPVYFDTKQDAAMNYGISSLPTTFFIDKEGYLTVAAEGQIDEKTLREGIGYIYGE